MESVKFKFATIIIRSCWEHFSIKLRTPEQVTSKQILSGCSDFVQFCYSILLKWRACMESLQFKFATIIIRSCWEHFSIKVRAPEQVTSKQTLSGCWDLGPILLRNSQKYGYNCWWPILKLCTYSNFLPSSEAAGTIFQSSLQLLTKSLLHRFGPVVENAPLFFNCFGIWFFWFTILYFLI